MSTITVETSTVKVEVVTGSVLVEVLPTVVDVSTLYGNLTFNVDGSTYIHTQATASVAWSISHGLGKYPSVAVIDSGGDPVLADVEYLSSNLLIINFSAAVGGVAYLN